MAAVAAGAQAPTPILRLHGLTVTFDTPGGAVTAARDVELSVAGGECLGVVGESGAGKSQLFLAVLGLLAVNGRAEGSARFGPAELLTLAPAALDQVRGRGIAMVFQDPMSSLTPHLTVGDQIAEVMVRHQRIAWSAARVRALALLERVHVSDARQRLRQYPYELSGGMRQRVMIAIALASEPQLLIADEPTTSLDVTIQAQILALLAELKRERGMAMVLITHDLGAVAGVADRVAVMHAGRVVETGPVGTVLKAPRDPHTRALLRDAGGLEAVGAAAPAARTGVAPALTVNELTVRYALGRGWLGRRAELTAVSHVSLELGAGESLAVVGESGCGKSTLARALVKLLPAAGRIVWMGRSLAELPARELRSLRRDLQIVFQDPFGSLDPRMTVAEIVAEPLGAHAGAGDAGARRAAALAALERVGLAAELATRYPHELSGGQAQRVSVARAMVLEPRLLVCDEPVSSLDPPTQQQIVALLATLQRTSGMTLVFISHNLALVRQLCARVLVLYLGRTMELAPQQDLFATPRHPYTRELLAAIPSPDPDVQTARLQRVLFGEPPSPLAPPSGCVFRTRCRHAAGICAERVPEWQETPGGGRVACHRWQELD